MGGQPEVSGTGQMGLRRQFSLGRRGVPKFKGLFDPEFLARAGVRDGTTRLLKKVGLLPLLDLFPPKRLGKNRRRA